MRVIQLTQRFPPALGGVEQHVFHLALGLSRGGIPVEVITTDLLRTAPFERMRSNRSGYPFLVTQSRVWKLFEAPHGMGFVTPSMLREVMGRSADLIHAHAYGFFPTFAGSLGSALDHAALVITPHSDAGRPSLGKSLFDRLVPPLTLTRAARVIAVSRHEADHLASLGVPSEKIRVIPNGVAVSEFDRVSRLRAAKPQITGLFVGRIDLEQKGLDTLVRAVALLPPSDGTRIRLVGEDWGGTAALRSLAQRLGVAERMTFVGRVDQAALHDEYANADYLVLPSVFEPFGIVLLEAMAARLPVIASRVGGIPEIVEDGRTGLLIEPGDPVALAHAMTDLSEAAELRNSMGREARDRVIPYDWESIIPRIISVYTEALEERGG